MKPKRLARKLRSKTDEDYPQWWDALHKAQDWDEAGLSHRIIADRLNREGLYVRGRLWSDMKVTRALDRHPKYPPPYAVKNLGTLLSETDPEGFIEVTKYGRDGKARKVQIGTAFHPGDFEDQEAYERFKREAAERASKPRWIDLRDNPKRAYPEPQPQNWAGNGSIDYTDQWTAGETTWDRWLLPWVAEQTRVLGWGFLERLDRLTGDPVDLAKLRWAYLGMMRRLAMREEANIALTAEVERLEDRSETP
jgi:hypothetical protein